MHRKKRMNGIRPDLLVVEQSSVLRGKRTQIVKLFKPYEEKFSDHTGTLVIAGKTITCEN